jgi:predicted esterase
MPKPRILCLHGGASNDHITQIQITGLKLYEKAECIFLHAPHQISQCYPGLNMFSEGPWYIWSNHVSGDSTMCTNQWEESLDYIAKFCRENGPFDGVYGFSQGTAIITNFSHPSIWKDKYKMELCPWKFAILACGGASHQINIIKSSPSTNAIIIYNIPSFHIFGRRDPILNDSISISNYWDPNQKEIYYHSRGHEIDMQISYRETELMSKFNIFLGKQLG